MSWFLIHFPDVDSGYKIEEFSGKDEIMDFINEFYIEDVKPEYMPIFLNDITAYNNREERHQFMIIKGEVKNPKSIEVVTKYILE